MLAHRVERPPRTGKKSKSSLNVLDINVKFLSPVRICLLEGPDSQ